MVLFVPFCVAAISTLCKRNDTGIGHQVSFPLLVPKLAASTPKHVMDGIVTVNMNHHRHGKDCVYTQIGDHMLILEEVWESWIR